MDIFKKNREKKNKDVVRIQHNEISRNEIQK